MLFYHVVMVTLSFVPFRTNTVWRKLCIPHVFYEKRTTVITYYSRFSKATPRISSLKNIFIPPHTKHTYTEIFTPTCIHIYTTHIQPTHASGILTSTLKPTSPKGHKIHVLTGMNLLCTNCGHKDTCTENVFVHREIQHSPQTGVRARS